MEVSVNISLEKMFPLLQSLVAAPCDHLGLKGWGESENRKEGPFRPLLFWYLRVKSAGCATEALLQAARVLQALRVQCTLNCQTP